MELQQFDNIDNLEGATANEATWVLTSVSVNAVPIVPDQFNPSIDPL
ncbi:MAG: hypothetical protein IPP61_00610 [Cytophagaceae bacterium]|nr:hypothetical protein [Cytophagaceae bacterium]